MFEDHGDMVYFGQPDDDKKPMFLARICNDGYEIGLAYRNSDHMTIMFRQEEMQELLPFIRSWLERQPWKR